MLSKKDMDQRKKAEIYCKNLKSLQFLEKEKAFSLTVCA